MFKIYINPVITERGGEGEEAIVLLTNNEIMPGLVVVLASNVLK